MPDDIGATELLLIFIHIDVMLNMNTLVHTVSIVVWF